MLRVRLIQVGAEVISGGVGSDRGHHCAVHTLREGPSAVTGWLVFIKMLLIIKGHPLQEVVQQLRCNGGVYSRATGHKRVHIMHALDVTGGETLLGLPVQSVHLWRKTDSSHNVILNVNLCIHRSLNSV